MTRLLKCFLLIGWWVTRGLAPAMANVTLPPLFCDHMVLQREITVKSPQVRQIRAVRYCFGGWTPGTIHNRDGLPLLPFRTDNWPIVVQK